MKKYKQDLVEKVRNGEAQIKVDSKNIYSELLCHIFPKRETEFVNSDYYFLNETHPLGHCCSHDSNASGLPYIHAEDFVIKKPKAKWVEVSDNEQDWGRRILVADLGDQVKFRYVVVDSFHEELFLNAGDDVNTTSYRYMRPAPEPVSLTHYQIEKLIGKPFRYVEEL